MSELASQIMNYVVRMVVPMRREFGCQLDVQLFLGDAAYRRGMLDQARKSQDPRLRDYASYVESRLQGARDIAPPAPAKLPAAAPAAVPAAPAASPAAAPSPAAAAPAAPTEAELRERWLQKYTRGLR
ncbi:hypothetical protein [Ideonella sp. YS5]|uniref:hypothetical protein n=1 Tax=Ideonella sp. YS5 TaxID=3453714 RepID=UPI003EED6811